jgi:hypothetical protein
MAAWAWYLPGVPFYVHAQDRPGALPEMVALAEAHWSYTDRFADRLILRGLTLSDDGTEHTGSVHVIDLDGRASATGAGPFACSVHSCVYWQGWQQQ